jgi:hypothetical protein
MAQADGKSNRYVGFSLDAGMAGCEAGELQGGSSRMRQRRVNQTVNQDGSVVRETTRGAWSPAQIIGFVAGLVFVVLGGVALAKTGLNFSNVALHHTQVAGLGATPVSALVELGVGLFLLAGDAHPSTAKATMSFFGALMLAFGLIVTFRPAPFFAAWDYTKGTGLFYVVVGAILLLAAALSPVFSSRRQVVVERASSARAEDDRAVPPADTPNSDSGYAGTYRPL